MSQSTKEPRSAIWRRLQPLISRWNGEGGMFGRHDAARELQDFLSEALRACAEAPATDTEAVGALIRDWHPCYVLDQAADRVRQGGDSDLADRLDALSERLRIEALAPSTKDMPRVIGQMPCHTPACGYVKGMSTTGLADVVQHGRLVRLMCQRCCGNWGLMDSEIKAISAPPKDDVVKVDPKALRIVAIDKKTGEREDITKRLYWFEENWVTSFTDWRFEFEITLHDPVTP